MTYFWEYFDLPHVGGAMSVNGRLVGPLDDFQVNINGDVTGASFLFAAVDTGVVQADIPRGSVIMDDSGAVPQQLVREDVLENRTIAFLARDVPAVGYRTYRIVPNAGSVDTPPRRFDGGKVLENDFYRVTFDPATGGIASIIDKKLKTELVDQASKYKLGQLIYVVGGEFKDHYWCWGPNLEKVKYSSPTDGKINPGASGPLFSSVKSSAKLAGFRGVELETILYEHERRKREEDLAAVRGEQRKIDFGSQIRSYTLHPQQRVKDHRTNLEAGNVDAVLEGDLDRFIRATLMHKAGQPQEKA